MAGRARSVRLMGSSGREHDPGAKRFAELLVGERGAWRHLQGFDGFRYESCELPCRDDHRATGDPLRRSGARHATRRRQGLPAPLLPVPGRRRQAAVQILRERTEAANACAGTASRCVLVRHEAADRPVGRRELQLPGIR